MRAGGVAALPNPADDLPALNRVARADAPIAQMRVQRLETAPVVQMHNLPIIALNPGKDHATVGRGMHRCTERDDDVNALVTARAARRAEGG